MSYQLLDFALKSRIITVRKRLLVDSASRFISRLDLNAWKSPCFDWKVCRAEDYSSRFEIFKNLK